MDEYAEINRERWNALADANVPYSRPFFDLTPEQARASVGRHGVLGSVEGAQVLCLAGGGGQDSAAFGLLGAQVTVLDISDTQLERERQAAEHHGYAVAARQGDMRDLSAFASRVFDIVWQPYSINFVPSVEPVFREAARVIKPGGIYYLDFANPFVHSVDEEAWNGSAYPLKHAYVEGEDLTRYYQHWDVAMPDGTLRKLPGPHEFRHTLSNMLNGLTASGFILLGLWEYMRSDEAPEPGTWAHFTQVAPPYLSTFWRKA